MQDYDAGLDGFTVQSHDSKLLGGLYRAAGVGPRPTAIVLHGLPGVEKNLDVASALRDSGWNCAYFHYRGSWGSQGNFTLAGRLDDLLAVTEWLVQQECVDGERLALIGHSAGGYLALTAMASDPRFRAVVALCPLLDPVAAPLSPATFDEWASMLNGVSGSELEAQWLALPAIQTMAERLTNRPILLLTGARDVIFPHSHYPPFLAAVPTVEWRVFANADHGFSLRRREMVENTVDWLLGHVGR